jgi:4-diphosphocytidyl-2-C-methyl-D-erythritol kinase
MASYRVNAPAKINLFLRVTGKRRDGYHNLLSLMCPLALHDTLIFKPGRGEQVFCDDPDVPENGTNLAVKAARLFMATAFAGTVDQDSGFSIHIEKRIPVGAGLGGGSSNAAAVLTFLNEHYRRPLSNRELTALGATLGADVPFFILGAPALASGIGDRLDPFHHLDPWHVLLIYPNLAVSTAWVYKNLNLRLTKGEKELRKLHFDARCYNAVEHLVNDLEAVTETAFPIIGEIKRLLLANGADGAMMTGSGSAVFGLFSNKERVLSARSALRRNPLSKDWLLFVTGLIA